MKELLFPIVIPCRFAETFSIQNANEMNGFCTQRYHYTRSPALRQISVWIWTKRIKTFTLKQIPVRDDKSGPDSSSRTGICFSVKVFIRLVQIQTEISLSVCICPNIYMWSSSSIKFSDNFLWKFVIYLFQNSFFIRNICINL